MHFPWLTWLVFFPLAGAALIMLLPASANRAIRLWSTVIAIAEFAFSLPLWWRFAPSQAGWQFEERHSWLPSLGATYHLGMDGGSLMLVLLTTVLTAVAVLGAWSAVDKRP